MPKIVTIVEPATGAKAKIMVDRGFNCFSFCPLVAGKPVELLWTMPNFEADGDRPTRSGIPILFPFAGRLSGTSFKFNDREIPLQIDPHHGYALHGFVYNRVWRVIAQGPASVTGEFQASIDDPELLKRWPADFRIRVCYELEGTELRTSISVDNPGREPLPFGLGAHGYFRVPLGSGASPDSCRISIPAESYWELDKMLPTGRKPPATGAYGVSDPVPFGEMKLDDVFTDLQSTAGKVTCRIDDPTTARRLDVVFDDSFRECVVFNPPHREAVCIEPYTCAPDAFALAERGIDAGLRILAPGESFAARVDMRFEE